MQKQLNFHIYGIHLLNPYKTVVSHLKQHWREIFKSYKPVMWKLTQSNAGNKVQTRAFFLRKILENSAKRRRRRMETALTYFAARRRQLITLCVLSLLLVVFRGMTVTHQYSRSCSRLERNNGWFSTVWSTYSAKRFRKYFECQVKLLGWSFPESDMSSRKT